MKENVIINVCETYRNIVVASFWREREREREFIEEYSLVI